MNDQEERPQLWHILIDGRAIEIYREKIMIDLSREEGYKAYHLVNHIIDQIFKQLEKPTTKIELKTGRKTMLYTIYSNTSGFQTDTMYDYFGHDEEEE